MSVVDEGRTAYLLRQVESATQNLTHALRTVETHAADTRQRLGAGQRVTGGIAAMLGNAPADVERYAGQLDALLNVATMLGIDDDALLTAYRAGAERA